MTWISADEVKKYSQITYDQLGFASDDAFTTWITATLLPRCEDIIEDYMRTTYTDETVGGTVKTVCALLAAKTLQFMLMNKIGLLVRVDDWNVKAATLKLFD
ncbi:MAG: hypothetical protein QXO25_03640, partial [Candidatus Bathyarchaeia archaeon]